MDSTSAISVVSLFGKSKKYCVECFECYSNCYCSMLEKVAAVPYRPTLTNRRGFNLLLRAD